jgi:TonB family protein
MKEKNKNKVERSDMLRYFNGEMTGRERNAFERKLQRELFSGEAAEGFSEITGDQLSSDLAQLDKRVKARTSRKSSFTFYRIAASVAVLLVLSSVFVFLNRKNREEQQVQIAVNQQVKIDVAKSKAIIEPESPSPTAQKDEAATDQNITVDSSEISVPLKMADQSVQEEVAAVPAAGAPAGDALKKTMNVMEKPIIAEDTLISDLNEVVAIGYNQNQKAADVSEGSSSPSPVGGKSAFENYITENMRKPVTLTEGETAVVILTVMVKSAGATDSIKVVSSPGKEFSDEAIRLIKEGPAWNPAENNGVKIDNEIRIRIIFK